MIDESTATHRRFEINRNGLRAAVLPSADDQYTQQGTIAVLSDVELLAGHREGWAALYDGVRIARPAAGAPTETLPEKAPTAAALAQATA